MEYPKPPIGVPPHWLVYRKRMEELNDAIGRYLNHIKSIHNISYTKQCFELIAQWAKELERLATLEIELERRADDEQTN